MKFIGKTKYTHIRYLHRKFRNVFVAKTLLYRVLFFLFRRPAAAVYSSNREIAFNYYNKNTTVTTDTDKAKKKYIFLNKNLYVNRSHSSTILNFLFIYIFIKSRDLQTKIEIIFDFFLYILV